CAGRPGARRPRSAGRAACRTPRAAPPSAPPPPAPSRDDPPSPTPRRSSPPAAHPPPRAAARPTNSANPKEPTLGPATGSAQRSCHSPSVVCYRVTHHPPQTCLRFGTVPPSRKGSTSALRHPALHRHGGLLETLDSGGGLSDPPAGVAERPHWSDAYVTPARRAVYPIRPVHAIRAADGAGGPEREWPRCGVE